MPRLAAQHAGAEARTIEYPDRRPWKSEDRATEFVALIAARIHDLTDELDPARVTFAAHAEAALDFSR